MVPKKGEGRKEFKYRLLCFFLRIKQAAKESDRISKIHKNITRKIYMEINNISPRQANKELNDLFEKKLIRKQGRGRAISYVLK